MARISDRLWPHSKISSCGPSTVRQVRSSNLTVPSPAENESLPSCSLLLLHLIPIFQFQPFLLHPCCPGPPTWLPSVPSTECYQVWAIILSPEMTVENQIHEVLTHMGLTLWRRKQVGNQPRTITNCYKGIGINDLGVDHIVVHQACSETRWASYSLPAGNHHSSWLAQLGWQHRILRLWFISCLGT